MDFAEMEKIESLLGVRYPALAQAAALAGSDIPQHETVVGQSYVSFPALGVSLVLPDNEAVSAIQLHASEYEGFVGYSGPIPGRLTFEMNRHDVRALLGAPVESGEEKDVILLGGKHAWDSFRLGAIKMHVEYSAGEGPIQLVTITRG
ncbi:hypothetical protein [Ralstonia pseudosolanacearum]|uniref:hypothetical protein n=1 Tax=Ralstonia pseudosolanacearum TaxID=1310165 RepID=UPI003CE915B0